MNPLLTLYCQQLKLKTGARLFLPLCGKTRDIAWLEEQGYQVVGAELSEIAIQSVFEALKITPTIKEINHHLHYQSDNIDLFVGDFFELSASELGHIDAIYDRAALVALPDEMRLRYTTHLLKITQEAKQLLVTLEYDQHLKKGAPFSIPDLLLGRYYQSHYKITLLQDECDEDTSSRMGIHHKKVWLLE